MIKNNFMILKKTHANLQTIAKAPVKFQKDWPKTVGGVEGTRYLLKIRNHAPRTTESRKQCPSAFLRKGGGQKENNKGIRTVPCGTKPGPNDPILLRLQQFAVVCSTEKNLSISVSSQPNSLLLRSSCGGLKI